MSVFAGIILYVFIALMVAGAAYDERRQDTVVSLMAGILWPAIIPVTIGIYLRSKLK